MLLNTEFSCYIHVYNASNYHEVEAEMGNDVNGIDKEYTLNSSIHSIGGWHSYNIWCNTTDEYGAVSESFEITHNGLETETTYSYTLLTIIGLIAILFLLS